MAAPEGRVDVVAAKVELANALGPSASEYWQVMRKFVRGFLGKSELDAAARTLLGPNMRLHNVFIEAILYNATVGPPPPAPDGSTGFADPHKRKRLLNEESFKVRRKRDILSLARADRQHIKSLGQKRKGAPRGSIVSMTPVPPRIPRTLLASFPDESALAGKLELCADTQELPSTESLQLRLLRRTVASGITDYHDDVVPALKQAVEFYIKGILQTYLDHVRAPTDAAAPVDFDAPPHVIRVRDLQATFQLAPYLLGESGYQLERITASRSQDEE